MNATNALPDRYYFRIGEVSAIVGVKPHVLRYWETEVGAVRPTRSRTGQRVYSRRVVELLLKLKEMLYVEGLTIAGARKRMHTEPRKCPSCGWELKDVG